MNGGRTREISPVQRAGKEFVIVVVIIFSSLSFTLGFFVGKKSGQGDTQNPPGASVNETADRIRQSATAQEMPPSAVVTTPQGNVPQTGAAVEDDQQQQPAEPIHETEEGAIAKARQMPDVVASRPPGEKKTADKKKEKSLPEITEQAKDGALYSVQLGALKNAAEAKRLKNKYARRGYSAYITVVSGKDKEKIYKVKAGKFRDRKDAELLALRLKKSGDLNAFVTGGNE